MDGTATKEHDSGQDGDFRNDQWVEIHDYHSPPQQSPIHEYNGFGFMSSHNPLEPTFNRSMMPSYSSHQPLQPLIMPQWPSMLTNPSNHGLPIPIPPPLAPVPAVAPAHPPPHPTPQTNASSARRTLTDQDRRRMCQYHEDNPKVKQTEIGAMFGVERSTVSKVLRQKDKYLFPDDGSRSLIKKSKGKFPDIERALSNWAKNHQRQGLPLSDNIIRDKARFFATTVGSSDSHIKVNSNTWLEKFKQKNHLLGSKPKKASDANDSDHTESKSSSNTPNGISPVSPDSLASPSPLSPSCSQGNLKTESPDTYFDFNSGYKHTHSQSTTSLASCFSDNTMPSPFSGGPASPTSPFFSPDVGCGQSPFSQNRLIPLAGPNTARPRSQTFPMLGIEPSHMSPTTSTDVLTPKYLQQSFATSALETPIEELLEPPLSIQDMMQTQQSHPSSSANTPNQDISPLTMAPPAVPSLSMSPRSGHSSETTSPVVSPPSQDEARQAMELVMTFFKHQPHGMVDAQEYIIMSKLMEKLKLHGSIGDLPGGLHSMDVGDNEHVRKRSIQSV